MLDISQLYNSWLFVMSVLNIFCISMKRNISCFVVTAYYGGNDSHMSCFINRIIWSFIIPLVHTRFPTMEVPLNCIIQNEWKQNCYNYCFNKVAEAILLLYLTYHFKMLLKFNDIVDGLIVIRECKFIYTNLSSLSGVFNNCCDWYQLNLKLCCCEYSYVMNCLVSK